MTGQVTWPSSNGVVAQRRRMRARFAVHLCLLATLAASLATVTLITEGWSHLVLGGVRGPGRSARDTTPPHLARLAVNLGRARTWFHRRSRLAWSDAVLALLTLNVLVSGTYDLLSGSQAILHPRDVGIPFRDIGWHGAGSC